MAVGIFRRCLVIFFNHFHIYFNTRGVVKINLSAFSNSVSIYVLLRSFRQLWVLF